jgi:hypothetical protein
MPQPVQSTREVGSTTSNASLKLFQSNGRCGQSYGVTITNLETSAVPLKIRVVPIGTSAPAITSGQEMWTVYPGDTIDLSPQGRWNEDVYVWGKGGAVVNYAAEETLQ